MRSAYAQGTCFGLDSPGQQYQARTCLVADKNKPNVLLWGDSLAAHISAPLRAALERAGVHMLQATHAACAPVDAGLAGDDAGCAPMNRAALTAATTQRVNAVILSASWSFRAPRWHDLAPLAATIAHLRSSGVRVFVLGPAVEYGDKAPDIAARALQRGIAPEDIKATVRADVAALDAAMRAHYVGRAGVVYVSVLDVMCPTGRCKLMADPTTPMQWDESHLTAAGGRIEATMLMRDGLASVLYPDERRLRP